MTSSQDSGGTRKPTFWLCVAALFAALVVLLYFPALTSYFSSDDFLHISTIIEGNLPFAPLGDGRGFFRPIIGWSLKLDYLLWGTTPFGYHAFNVLVHLANSLLVVALYRALIPNDKTGRVPALAAGLIFLTMACHAEPVSWISGRTDLIATFFALLSLVCTAHAMRGRSAVYSVIAVTALAAALFSKESTLAVPVLAIVIAVYINISGLWRMSAKRFCCAVGVGLLVISIYFVARHHYLGAFVGGYGVRGHLRFHQDLLAQATSRFAWRVLLPPLPRAMGGFAGAHGRVLADVFTVLLFLHAVLWATMAWRRAAWRTGFFLYTAFWIALLPVINLRIQWTNTEGERFLYLASIFAALGLAWALQAIPQRNGRSIALIAMLIFQSVFLWTATSRWEYASNCARDIITGIQADEGEGSILLLNKPDSFDGALLFRTGLPEAIRYFGPEPQPTAQLEALFATDLYQRDHRFGLEETESGDLSLRALDKTSLMVEEDAFDRIEVLDGNRREFTFRFRDKPEEARLFGYDSRGLRRYHVGD